VSQSSGLMHQIILMSRQVKLFQLYLNLKKTRKLKESNIRLKKFQVKSKEYSTTLVRLEMKARCLTGISGKHFSLNRFKDKIIQGKGRDLKKQKSIRKSHLAIPRKAIQNFSI
jgi:hypothetical protein